MTIEAAVGAAASEALPTVARGGHLFVFAPYLGRIPCSRAFNGDGAGVTQGPQAIGVLADQSPKPRQHQGFGKAGESSDDGVVEPDVAGPAYHVE
jgi:hypothetical protein